nr:hypothetical protein [Actinomadura madurae]
MAVKAALRAAARQDPDDDGDVVGGGQGGRHGGDAPSEEAVLGKPELVETGILGMPRDPWDVRGWQLRREGQPDPN